MHNNSHHGMKAAEFCQYGKQIKRGKLVGGDRQLTLMQVAQLGDGLGRVAAKIEQALRVSLQDAPGLGQPARAGEAAFASHGKKYFQLRQIHDSPLNKGNLRRQQLSLRQSVLLMISKIL